MKTLLADPFLLKLEKIISGSDAIVAHVKTRLKMAACPSCQHLSIKVHSRYTRCVADLPWEGIRVRLHLRVRKFFCHNQACRQGVFCERLPSLVAPYSRQTVRLNEALTLIGLALGGRAGTRMADGLGLRASAETLLRRVRRRAHDFKFEAVRVLGVDDWAMRRGYTYGTLLIDIERSRPVGLLPDREAATLAAWLKGQPGIEVATRDRATFYAEGLTQGAPAAIQVADRWHLLKNLSDAVERVVNRHRKELREVAQAISPQCQLNERVRAEGLPMLQPASRKSPRSVNERALTQERRAARIARYEEIKRMRAAGVSISAIARHFGMQRSTVRMFVRADEYPEARPPRPELTKVQRHAAYLQERWLEGCHNAKQLYREIKERGYTGHVKVLQRYLQQWRKLLPEEIRRKIELPTASPPAPRRVTWWLLTKEEKLGDAEREFITTLIANNPVINRARALAGEFQRMVHERDEKSLSGWLDQAERSEVAEFVNFAKGLHKDIAAVDAAMKYEWSNGMVEGHVNRLKLIKRQMYGRAKFDLLRARVLLAA